MPAVKLTFTSPTHGWLPTRIELMNEVLEFVASDVPNNPIEELCSAVSSAAAGREGEVWWHLEPDGYFFEISGANGGARLRILFSEHSISSPKIEVASVTGTKAEVLLPLWRALREFESFNTQEPHWPRIELVGLEELREILRDKTGG